MNDFKIGNRVRRFKEHHGGMNPGDTATVRRKDSSTCFYLKEYKYGHDPRNFKLAKIDNWKEEIGE